MNPNVFRNLSYGVYVVSSLDGDRNTGCIANSIMQITSSPATIALSMNHDNYTNSCISRTGKFAISILSETSDRDASASVQEGMSINSMTSITPSKKDFPSSKIPAAISSAASLIRWRPRPTPSF